MEETGTTIHSRLTRRNNFLRENPQSGHFVARDPATRHQGFTEGPKKAPNDGNDSARSGASSPGYDGTVTPYRQALRGVTT
jgi:hypothetical protein